MQDRLKRIEQDQEDMVARLEIAMRDILDTIKSYDNVKYPDHSDNLRYIFDIRTLPWDTYLVNKIPSLDQVIDNPIAVRTLSPDALSGLYGLRSLRLELFSDASKFKDQTKKYQETSDPDTKKRVVEYAMVSTKDFQEIMTRSFNILCVERNRINDGEPKTGNYFISKIEGQPTCPDIKLNPLREPSS